jgi:hypothetical protein
METKPLWAGELEAFGRRSASSGRASLVRLSASCMNHLHPVPMLGAGLCLHLPICCSNELHSRCHMLHGRITASRADARARTGGGRKRDKAEAVVQVGILHQGSVAAGTSPRNRLALILGLLVDQPLFPQHVAAHACPLVHQGHLS